MSKEFSRGDFQGFVPGEIFWGRILHGEMFGDL